MTGWIDSAKEEIYGMINTTTIGSIDYTVATNCKDH